MTSYQDAPNRTERVVARVADLTKTYGEGVNAVTALDGVDLEIRAGEFTAIMGPSGSGKSTLMHLIAGLDTPTSGRAWIGGREITGLDDGELTLVRRRSVGLVFQAFNLVPTLDVAANIRFPFELDGRRPTTEEEFWIGEVVRRLGLQDRLRHRPSELSGGQQQRVAIARALAARPALIVADEPTGNLDSRTGREVLDLLTSAVRDDGQAIVMVTHDPIAASRADRVVVLADGRIVADRGAGTPEQLSRLVLELGTAA